MSASPKGSTTGDAARDMARRLALLMVANRLAYLLAGWLFAWGLAALLLRMTLDPGPGSLLFGALGVLPMALLAVACERRRFPGVKAVGAILDDHNGLGGLLMAAQEGCDIRHWRGRGMRVTPPPVRWDARRPLAVTLTAAAFVVLCFVVPRPTGVALGRERLEIDDILDDLSAKIDVLEEEQILEEEQADTLSEALEQLADDASGEDPARTWEAIDHLSARLSDEAVAEAEEALARAADMARTEALAEALAEALGDAAAAPEAPEAAEELAALLEQMGLGDALPEAVMDALQAGQLSPDDLARLAEALRDGQAEIAGMVQRLANARLVEGAMCQRCGECTQAGDAELAAFLAQVGEGGECAALVGMLGGRGGISRGRGDAAMTWTGGSSEDGAGFIDESLPTDLSGLEDSRLVGISQGTPETNDGTVAAASGALNGAAAGPGSASKHRLLPRHRGAVQRFFSRE